VRYSEKLCACLVYNRGTALGSHSPVQAQIKLLACCSRFGEPDLIQIFIQMIPIEDFVVARLVPTVYTNAIMTITDTGVVILVAELLPTNHIGLQLSFCCLSVQFDRETARYRLPGVLRRTFPPSTNCSITFVTLKTLLVIQPLLCLYLTAP